MLPLVVRQALASLRANPALFGLAGIALAPIALLLLLQDRAVKDLTRKLESNRKLETMTEDHQDPKKGTQTLTTPTGLGLGLPSKATLSAPSASTSQAAPAPLTGSAAMLAKMRKQPSAPSAPAASLPPTAENGSAAPLTGSAALLAKMRPSADLTPKNPSPFRGSVDSLPWTPVDPKATNGAPLTGSAAILARMSQQRDSIDAAATARPPAISEAAGDAKFLVLYGGEAATQVATDLAEAAECQGLNATLMCLDKYKEAALDTDPCKVVVFVVETVENALPAESAGHAVRFFNRKRKNGVKGVMTGKLKYAMVCVGDTNLLLDRQTTTAKDCNQAGITLDSALTFLGAESLCNRCLTNDAVGIEESLHPWRESTLWPALKKALLPEAAGAKEEEAEKEEKEAEKELLILYGSQTGNSMEIAKQIGGECPANGVKARVMAMEQVKMATCLIPGTVVMFVVSSTGDGDPPDNCALFYAHLRKMSHPNNMLNSVRYTVLGLGDQNYTAFMEVPRQVWKRMGDLGAASFYARGEADEVEGLDEFVEEWTNNLWVPLRKALKTCHVAPSARKAEEGEDDTIKGELALPKCKLEALVLPPGTVTASPLPPAGDAPPYSAHAPFYASRTSARLLTSLECVDRRVLHLEVDLEGSGLSYNPGDSIGVLPANDPAMVEALLLRLGLDGDQIFTLQPKGGSTADLLSGVDQDMLLPHLRLPCSVRTAFTFSLDVTSPPRKTLVRTLAEYGDAKEAHSLKKLSSRGGKELFTVNITKGHPTLLQVLTQYPSVRHIPLAVLLDALPPLMPRHYSLTSAPAEHPSSAHVAFSVVAFDTPAGHPHRGVATTWLDRCHGPNAPKGGAPLPLFLKAGGQFHPPADLVGADMIMVGPGTGVAPFRGFLQARRAAIKANPGQTPGQAWLFFGCRHRDQDYLYKEELEAMAEDGTISRLVTAFSREEGEKMYVQHRMMEHAEELAKLVMGGAYFYVCGDGGQMAKNVNNTLVTILEKHSGLKEKDVSMHVRDMTKEGKYVRDIWS